MDAARRKRTTARTSWLSLVAGPTAALLATLRRIGWKCCNATTLTTDEGQFLDLEVGPPIVFASAAKRAVRRMRWNEVSAMLLGVFPPTEPDGDSDQAGAQRTFCPVHR